MAEQKNVFVIDRFSSDALMMLKAQPFLNVQSLEKLDVVTHDLSEVNALVIRSGTHVDRRLFAKAKKLQVVITATSGFDHIDLEAAKEWGITVMFTPEANVESAAQLTWALVLACAHRIPAAQREVKSGEWRRNLVVGTQLHGKTYGVIGMGRIGRRVAEFARTFGMHILAYDPYLDDKDFRDCSAERVAFEEILKRSDVLSFHVPKTAETDRMLHRSHLEYINRGILLVNTSRGSVFVEADIAEAVEKGWIGSLGMDVFEKEPLARTSKLLSHPQVVLTPHIGANTAEAFALASEQAAMKLIRFFVDGSTSETLPPKTAWYGAQPPFQNTNT